MQLDPQSRDLLIRTVYGEAGNQAPDGQSAVANVVLNRLNSGQFGKTIQDVVFAPNQFEPWGTRRAELMALRPDSPAYLSAASVVDSVLGGNAKDNTFGATHFLNPEIVRRRRGGTLPDWAAGTPTATIGAHSFYLPQNGPGRIQMANNNPASWGAIPTQSQNPNVDGPSAWGAVPSSNAVPVKHLWGNTDGSQLPRTAAPRTMQRTPFEPEIDRLLDRETQNANPAIAREARVEQHIRDDLPQVMRNALMSNPLTAALSQVFPAEMVVQGLSYGLSDEMLAFLKSKVSAGDYEEILEANRERMQRTRNESPVGSVAGEVSGNLLTTPAAAGANIFKGATYLPRLGNTILNGGALSALYGFGTGEGQDQRLQQLWQQGLLGAGLGMAGESAVSGITALLRRGFGANRAPAANVNPQQRIAESAEFNIPLTTGEATGNLRQQAWENAARNNARGDYPGTQIQAFDAQRANAINKAANETIGSQFGPRVAVDEAGDMTVRAMRDRAALLRADSDAAYQRAADKGAWIAADEVTNLAQRVSDGLDNAGVRLDTLGNYPGANSAMNILRRAAGFEGASQNGVVVAESLEGLERVRRSLYTTVKPANAADAVAVREIRKQFDNWVSDAIDKRLFQGDPTALDDLKAARSLWSQYKGMTAAKEGPMQIISKMVNEERTGAEVANWLLSSSTVGQAGNSARVAAQVKRIVGATSDEWQAIRASAWDRVVNDTTGKPRNAQQIAKAIDDLTRGNGKALARQLYSGTEIAQMQRLSVAIRNTATDPRAFNPSRSGYEVVRALSDKLGLAIFGTGAGATGLTGDPKWVMIASLPALRSVANVSKLNAALRPTSSAWGQTAGEVFRIPQRSAPALLSSWNQ